MCKSIYEVRRMKDFLFEIFTEEMPATQIKDIEKQLQNNFEEFLKEKEIGFEEIIPFSTIRRFGLYIKNLSEKQKDKEEEITGPPFNVSFKENNPAEPLIAFLKKEGLEGQFDKVYKLQKGKGEYVAIKKKIEGRETIEILKNSIPALILKLQFIKPMYWADGIGPFVRPVHSILCIYGEEKIDFELFKVKAGNSTFVLKNREKIQIKIDEPKRYFQVLRENNLEPFFEKRKEKILKDIENLKNNLNYRNEENLIDEWAYLSEFPTVVMASFKDEYLNLPEEILKVALKKHQKAITLYDENGKITKKFLCLIDKPFLSSNEIIKGIEWVVEARLKDASFFFEQDLKNPLSSKVEELQKLSFHSELGNFLQKTGRILELSEFIAYNLGKQEKITKILNSAKLSKADLLTSTVAEFPELQGKIGGILLKIEKYDEEIWKAVYEQYFPESPEGPYPSNEVSEILNISDKIETIVSLISAGEIPTGSQDPYGLRRYGNGLVDILIEKEIDCDLDLIFTKAIQILPSSKIELKEVLEILRNFIKDRVEYIFERRGISKDTIKATIEVRHFNPYDAFQRAKAIEIYRKEKEFINFILSFKRLRNIIKGYENFEINPSLFKEKEEPKLYEDFLQVKEEFLQHYNHKNYLSALKVMTVLAPALEEFFEKVFVLCKEEELKKNRIGILQSIYREFLKIAQFSHLIVEKNLYKEIE